MIRVIALGSPHGGDDEVALTLAQALAARGAIPHDTSLVIFDEGFVTETCSTPGTAAFRLRALAENPGARSRDGLRHGLLADDDIELVLAGRPGAGLLDLLDTPRPVVLLDVVRSGAPAGTIFDMPLTDLCERALASEQVSSHGFGPAEALRLAAALGRELPRGRFVGIEGAQFELGTEPSAPVCAKLPEFERRARAAIRELSCTNPV